MVKDLIATLARDGADIGLFITLAAPTKAMTTEAAAAGFYESPNGKKYPPPATLDHRRVARRHAARAPSRLRTRPRLQEGQGREQR